MCGLSVKAADPKGTLEVVLYPDSGTLNAYQVNDTGDKLVGVSGATVYLQKQEGGFQGFSFGRPFNLTCTVATVAGSSCTDKGSTEVNLKLTKTDKGYNLKGTLNYVSVEAKVTDSKISITANGHNTNIGMELNRQRSGAFSGRGESNVIRTFEARMSGKGSLKDFAADPATLIAVVISPFVRD